MSEIAREEVRGVSCDREGVDDARRTIEVWHPPADAGRATVSR